MFELKMLTSDGKKHVIELSRISLPTPDGIRTILANHMDTVIPVDIGKLKLIQKDKTDTVVVSDGLFNFRDNSAHLFVRTFEFAEDIDKDRAQRAKTNAEETLEKGSSLTDLQQKEAKKALKRAKTRLDV